MIRLSERAARYGEFAHQLRAIDGADISEQDRLARFGPLLADFVADPSIFPANAFALVPGTPGGLFRLVEHADHRATVYVSLGVTGRAQPPHRHRGWALVAGITGGVETNRIFEFHSGTNDLAGHLIALRHVDVGAGEIAEIAGGEYHTIEVISDTPVLHIHAYSYSVDDPDFYSPAFASPESTTYQLKSNAGFNPPFSGASAEELIDDLAEGKAGLILVDGLSADPALRGPHLLSLTWDGALNALKQGVLSRSLPLVIGAKRDAGQRLGVAAIEAGYPLVFLLA